MSTQVAVVGLGPLGLMALKNFKDDGFDVTGFEGRDWVGGLWKYSTDDSLSTAENTIFNTSKYRTGITDFPVPEDMDDFATAPQLHKYFESYCDEFDLWPHLNLGCRVKSLKREKDQWALAISPKDNEEYVTYFDKVAFSCGPFVEPRQPNFESIDVFQGKTLHAINFHEPYQFKDENVLVVGVHASSQDIVSQLAEHSSKVYLSHRNGVTLIARYAPDGSVYDKMPPLGFTIVTLYLSACVPTFFNWIINKLVLSMAKKGFPNPPASLGSLATTKAPNVSVAPPLIASELYPHFESGFCEGVPEVRRITGSKTVELVNGRVLEDIDTIIYCTGYHSVIPVDFEPQGLNPYPYPGSPPNLYRHIFPLHPDPAIRNSLAFLGQGAVSQPGFAQHEFQGICVSQIWKGNSALPPLAQMQRWHREYLSWRDKLTKQYNAGSTFYTAFLPVTDHMIWMDSCAGSGIRHHFGLVSRWIHWRAWKLWWTDRKLYNTCLTGFTSPAIFRLFDIGKRKAWPKAREQIFIDNERVDRQQWERQKMLEKQKAR